MKLKCYYLNILKYNYKTGIIHRRTAVDLSYKLLGDHSSDDSPPVFILHGLLGSKRNWNGIGKIIANVTKRNVVAVDLRNHGDSPHVQSHEYTDLASDVLQLMEKLKMDRATLIGHSMGGRTAMVMSLVQPKKIYSAIVVDISPVVTTRNALTEMLEILDTMKNIDFKGLTNIDTAKTTARKHLSAMISNDIALNAVLMNIKTKPDKSIGWMCNIDALIKYLPSIANFPNSMVGKKYDGPTLFLGGQDSEFLPPDDLNGIRDFFPSAVVKYVPKAGHNIHADNPEKFLELVLDFIRSY